MMEKELSTRCIWVKCICIPALLISDLRKSLCCAAAFLTLLITSTVQQSFCKLSTLLSWNHSHELYRFYHYKWCWWNLAMEEQHQMSALITCCLFLHWIPTGRSQLKCDGTRAGTRFRLSAKLTSPFKSAGTSVQSTTGSRGVRISGSNAGYTMFRGSVKGTGYTLHSTVSPSLPLPCVTVCHHISTAV